MTIEQLLEGVTATDASGIVAHIQSKLTEQGCKLFIDDGKQNIYIPKSRLDDALEKHRVAQETIKAQAGTITNLQKQASDSSAAQLEVDKLKTTIAENEKTIKGLAIKSALSAECEKMGFVIPADDVMKFIDAESIVVGKDGDVIGVSEALKTLSKSKPYLVKAQEEGDKGNSSSSGGEQQQQQMFQQQGGTGDPGKASNAQFGSQGYKAGSFGKLLGESVAKQSTGAAQATFFK